ncbi:MAG: PEGA domain-containing protein [Deltaproteobacteria bacterium]|nr:PEGA domain-containing protein [Deltaproteobacteria bacterium]
MVKHLLVFLVLAFAPATASADVGVVVAGEATMQPQLVRQIEGWLKKHGHTLVAVALPSDAIATLVDCFVIEDEACARGVIEKRGRAQSIVFARVDVQAGGDIEKTVTVTAYWFEKGAKAGSARRFCERCSDATLRTTADDLMASLAKVIPRSNGKVKITSNPIGATCDIDGKAVGSTPFEGDVPEGSHEITVTRERHRTETRTVTVKAGETTDVEVALSVVETSGKPSRTLPIITIGTGAALILTGVVMLAIDEDKGPDEPPEISNTAPLGVGLAIGGALAVGGGMLWYRMTGKTESRPVAAIAHGSAYIGWLGRF